MQIARHDTALHQRKDGRWECFSTAIGDPLKGYCLPDYLQAMIANGHPAEGLSWERVWKDPENHTLASVIARCTWITEAAWEHDRLLRIANKSKFHFHGHATDDEAIACYQQFLTDFWQQEI